MNTLALLDQLDRLGFAAMQYLLSALWQSSLLFAATFALAWFLRKRRASVRHLIWVAALLLAPLLPVLTSGVRRAGAPQAPVSVLPAYAVSAPVPRMEPLPEPPPSPVVLTPSVPAPREIESHPVMPAPRNHPWVWCLASYAVGLTLLFAWIAAGRLRIRHWIRSARPAKCERVLAVFRSAREETQLSSHRAPLPFLSLPPAVEVLEGPGVPAPISTGILHPRVLLPVGLADRLSDEELRALALHEIAHLKRRDPLVLTLAALVRAVLFFHPLVWPAARQISALAEQCADDAVLEATGQPLPYAKMLARLAEELPPRPFATEMATGILLSKGAFPRRVEAILSGRRSRLSRWALVGTLIAVLVSLVIVLAVPLGKSEHEGLAVVSDGPLKIRFAGVQFGLSDSLFDRRGRKIGEGLNHPYVGPSKENANWRFIFELPEMDGTQSVARFLKVSPSGEERWLGGSQALVIEVDNGVKELIAEVRTSAFYEKNFSLWSRKTRLKEVDVILQYYYGTARGAACFFRGPFQAGKTVESAGFSLVMGDITNGPPPAHAAFLLSSNAWIETALPPLAYDKARKRYMGSWGSGHSGPNGSEYDIRFDGIRPSEIELITINEAPYEVRVNGISVVEPRQAEEETRTRLDGIAKALGLSSITFEELGKYDFYKNSGRAVDSIRLLCGLPLRRALDAIQHGEPRLKAGELPPAALESLRQTALQWAKAPAPHCLIGIEMGLWGGWPEFYPMALDILAQPNPLGLQRDREGRWFYAGTPGGFSNDLFSRIIYPMQARYKELPDELVPRIQKATLVTSDPSVSGILLGCLLNRKSPATTDALRALAQDERPWIWVPALHQIWLRKALPPEEQLSSRDKLRLAAARAITEDQRSETPPNPEIAPLLLAMLTPDMMNLYGFDFSNLLRAIPIHCGRDAAKSAFVEFVQRLDPSTRNYGPTHQIVRWINIEYEVNIGGIGTDPNATADPDPAKTAKLIADLVEWSKTGVAPGGYEVEKPVALQFPEDRSIGTVSAGSRSFEARGRLEIPAWNYVSVDIRQKPDSFAFLEQLKPFKGVGVQVYGVDFGDANFQYLHSLPTLNQLGLIRTGITDASLANLESLTSLTELRLNENAIEGQGLAALHDFSELRHISLAGCRLTDGALDYLKNLPKLRDINLSDNRLTDEALQRLMEFRALENVLIGGNPITDAGLAHLSGTTRLHQLYLERTPITDAGLEHLKSLANLESLNLSRTNVTDAGLSLLTGLPKLGSLDLFQSRITDSGVGTLNRLSNLSYLDVRLTGISDSGLTELRKNLPKCTIYPQPGAGAVSKKEVTAGSLFAWGETVGGIRCALAPLRSSFTAGEDIALDLVYLNVSNKPITVCVYPDPYFIWTFLEIKNERGQRMAAGLHASGGQRGLALSDFVTLAPGKTASVRYNLPRWQMGRPQLEPGTYFASVELSKINRMEKHIYGYEALCRANGLKPWTGLIGSGPAKLTIVPMPEIAWGETVEGLRVGVGAPEITATSITLSMFLRNTRNDDKCLFDGANFDLEMDGRPYAHCQWALMNGHQETVYPGQIRGPIRLLLSDYVAEADRKNAQTAPRPLANLPPGEHRLRVTYVGMNGQPRIAAPEQVIRFQKGRGSPVKTETSVPAASAADFEELAVEMKCFWWSGVNRVMRIGGDGKVAFSLVSRTGRDYASTYQLSKGDLATLAGLLRATDWLHKPPEKVMAVDALEFSLSLKRSGETARADFLMLQTGPYQPLERFLTRLAEQEHLLYRLSGGKTSKGADAASMLASDLRGLMRRPGTAEPAEPRVLDYSRFLPIMRGWLAKPGGHPAGELEAAVVLAGYLRDESARKDIESLMMKAKVGAVEGVPALVRIGNPASAPVLGRMARKGSGHSDAAWGLVQMGDAALSTILEIVGSPIGRDGGDPTETMIRAYIDHWKGLPAPPSADVIKAVRADMEARRQSKDHHPSTEYHQQFLRLLDDTPEQKEKAREKLNGLIRDIHVQLMAAARSSSSLKGYDAACLRELEGKLSILFLPENEEAKSGAPQPKAPNQLHLSYRPMDEPRGLKYFNDVDNVRLCQFPRFHSRLYLSSILRDADADTLVKRIVMEQSAKFQEREDTYGEDVRDLYRPLPVHVYFPASAKKTVEFAADKEIPLNITVGTREEKDLLKLVSVRFERVKERLYGFVRVEERTVADTSWFISLRFFLLRSGESPGDGSWASYTTHVEPRGYPATRRGEIQVCNAPWDYAAGIRRVECEIRRHDQYRPELSVHFPVSDTADAGAENRDEALKAAQQARPSGGNANAVEGSLELDIPILLPVGLSSPRSVLTDGSARPHPIVFQYPWLEFHETEGRLDAELHLRYESWPKTKWVLAVELLDAAGKTLARTEAGHENSGTIAKYPLVEEEGIRFDFGKRSDLPNAKHFRFSIESVWTEQAGRLAFDKEIPLQMELNGLKYSKSVMAPWVRFTNRDLAYEAVVRCSQTVPGPKSHWRVTARLLGEQDKVLGESQSDFKNEGTEFKSQFWWERDIRLPFTAPASDLAAATGFVVTLERLLAFDKESSPTIKAPELPPILSSVEWGEEVEGVQLRLRAEKPSWSADETVILKADIKNLGDRVFFFVPDASASFPDLEYDGEWYWRPTAYRGPLVLFSKGESHYDILIPLEKGYYTRLPDPTPLVVSPGKHTLRVGCLMHPNPQDPVGNRARAALVRVVSNPVEIEVVSAPLKKSTAGPRANAKFEKLSVEMRWNWWGGIGREIQIAPTGHVRYAQYRGNERDKALYESEFDLSAERLAGLTRILEKTDWFQLPPDKVGATDAVKYKATLTKDGSPRSVEFEFMAQPLPYSELETFLGAMEAQEDLLRRISGPAGPDRLEAARTISKHLRRLREDPSRASVAPVMLQIDFARFAPVMSAWLEQPKRSEYQEEERSAAATLTDYLRRQSWRVQPDFSQEAEGGITCALSLPKNAFQVGDKFVAKLVFENHTKETRTIRNYIVKEMGLRFEDGTGRLLTDAAIGIAGSFKLEALYHRIDPGGTYSVELEGRLSYGGNREGQTSGTVQLEGGGWRQRLEKPASYRVYYEYAFRPAETYRPEYPVWEKDLKSNKAEFSVSDITAADAEEWLSRLAGRGDLADRMEAVEILHAIRPVKSASDILRAPGKGIKGLKPDEQTELLKVMDRLYRTEEEKQDYARFLFDLLDATEVFPEPKLFACEWLARRGDDTFVPWLTRYVQALRPEEITRYDALSPLFVLGSSLPPERKKTGTVLLLQIMKDAPEAIVRGKAEQYLKAIADPSIIPELVKTLKDRRNRARVAAAEVLGAYAGPDVLPALEAMRDETKDKYLIRNAKAAIEAIEKRQNKTSRRGKTETPSRAAGNPVEIEIAPQPVRADSGEDALGLRLRVSTPLLDGYPPDAHVCRRIAHEKMPPAVPPPRACNFTVMRSLPLVMASGTG